MIREVEVPSSNTKLNLCLFSSHFFSFLVLPVGGLKEKLLAAHRAGISQVILPAQNRPNVEADVPEVVLEALKVHYVHNVWSALDVAFGEGPWSSKAKEMEEVEERERLEDEKNGKGWEVANKDSK